MINSLEIYKQALNFAKNNLTADAAPVLKNFYLQIVTITFYELTTRKTSMLISALCRVNRIPLTAKNFFLVPAQMISNLHTSFDLFAIVYGLNVALAENLDSCLNVFDRNSENIFRGLRLNEENLQELQMNLTALDASLGKFLPVQKESTPNLNDLIDKRHADDEKILAEIKKVQLELQEELPRLQGTLKKISEIRDGLEYKTLEEPINQLIQLFDKVHETLQRHPQADMQKGYETLLKRCKNFSRFIEQSLAMLGAQLINEINIPLDFSKHIIMNGSRPLDSAVVSKILRVGLIYKGQILRKAEVEVL